jgi:hypothetical protein
MNENYTIIVTKCFSDEQPNGQSGPIDPTKPEVYKLIQQLFPEEYFQYC